MEFYGNYGEYLWRFFEVFVLGADQGKLKENYEIREKFEYLIRALQFWKIRVTQEIFVGESRKIHRNSMFKNKINFLGKFHGKLSKK